MAALMDIMEIAPEHSPEFAPAFAPLISPMVPEEFPEVEVMDATIVRRIIVNEQGLDIDQREILLLNSSPDDFRAYYLVKTLRQAIYGRVISGCRVEPTTDPDRVRLNENAKVAIKMMSLSRIAELEGRHAENPMSEIACMNFIKGQGGHPNVLTYVDLCTTDTHLFLVLPYCNGGELFGTIEYQGKLPPESARMLFRQMVQSVEFLGRSAVCHRDLSLENVLVHHPTEEGQQTMSIVIDFGMALRIPCDAEGHFHYIEQRPYAGKLNYSAPEVVAQEDFDGSKIDVWALGVMLFIMLVGIPPWSKASRADQRYMLVVSGQLPALLNFWNVTMPQEAMNLLQRIFVEDVASRISIPEIMRHPWYTGESSGA